MGWKPESNIPDLTGKVALVTGGNAGIGASIVKGLAPHNAHIFICARKAASGEALVKEIQTTHPDAKLSVLTLDLSSFDSIRKCAEAFNAQSARLDLLFLNAGMAGLAPALTAEGYEQTFGVNHVGHALLAQLLLPKMQQTQRSQPDADVRIMVTSSIGGFRFAPKTGLDLAQMRSDDAFGSHSTRYGHSKLANMLFARKLAQLYPGITSTSFHPGTVKTEIWGKATDMKLFMTIFSPVLWLVGVSADTGAIPGLWTAVAKTGTGKGEVENGRYYPPSLKAEDSQHSKNQKLVDELWDWTTKELAEHGGPGWPKA